MKQNFKLMGILNLTPNSFSDGGKYNSVLGFTRRLSQLMKFNHEIIDLGAESTAPINDSINEELEIRRFEYVFKQLSFLPSHSYSIDTYRKNTFTKMSEWLKRLGVEDVYWNDISGNYMSAIDLLVKNSNFKYIFTHSFLEPGVKVSRHLEYNQDISIETLIDKMEKKFNQVRKDFTERNLLNHLIFDPGFGFSKTKLQNLELMENLPNLIKKFPKEIPWLIGVSRKSFLRTDEDNELPLGQKFINADTIQDNFLKKLVEKLPEYHFIFRVHQTPEFAVKASRSRNFAKGELVHC